MYFEFICLSQILSPRFFNSYQQYFSFGQYLLSNLLQSCPLSFCSPNITRVIPSNMNYSAFCSLSFNGFLSNIYHDSPSCLVYLCSLILNHSLPSPMLPLHWCPFRVSSVPSSLLPLNFCTCFSPCLCLEHSVNFSSPSDLMLQLSLNTWSALLFPLQRYPICL